MKGGATLYQLLIEQTTTLPLTADELHQLGLSEVARIRGEMEKVKTEVGFKGTLPQFFDHLRTDAKFKPKSREWLTRRLLRDRQGGRRADPRIFLDRAARPSSRSARYEPFREKFEAGGSYQQGTPDGVAAGHLLFQRLRPAVPDHRRA